MPKEVRNPRNYPAARILRQTEPYAFQRNRQIGNKQPRPAQPNTNQPNQKPATIGFGMSTEDYYKRVFQDYLKGRR